MVHIGDNNDPKESQGTNNLFYSWNYFNSFKIYAFILVRQIEEGWKMTEMPSTAHFVRSGAWAKPGRMVLVQDPVSHGVIGLQGYLLGPQKWRFGPYRPGYCPHFRGLSSTPLWLLFRLAWKWKSKPTPLSLSLTY